MADAQIIEDNRIVAECCKSFAGMTADVTSSSRDQNVQLHPRSPPPMNTDCRQSIPDLNESGSFQVSPRVLLYLSAHTSAGCTIRESPQTWMERLARHLPVKHRPLSTNAATVCAANVACHCPVLNWSNATASLLH